MDNIAAVSTPQGRSAIALIRVSGPNSLALALGLSGLSELPIRKPLVVILKDGAEKVLDEAVLTYFAAPNSYTGEDLIEIGCHGNPIIVERLLSEIVSRETFRLAEPGEFTRRALVNEKLKLDEVEALDIILNAESGVAARLGLQAKLGGIRSKAEALSESLLHLSSELEAQLDFQENEVGNLGTEEVIGLIEESAQVLERWQTAFERNRSYLSQTRVALAGKPNAGKSSLFNSILGQEKAIVHETPGTTRDYLEHRFELEGMPILLWDTAGIREVKAQSVESIGISRSQERMKESEVVIWVDEEAELPPQNLFEGLKEKDWIFVQSKADLKKLPPSPDFIQTSSKTGQGLDRILADILRLRSKGPLVTEEVPVVSERQSDLIKKARTALTDAAGALKAGYFLDQVTEKVRQAASYLNELVPKSSSEDVLKRIFSRFCIGK